MLHADALVSVLTLVAAVTLFISRRLPLVVTALLIPVTLAMTGALDPAGCLAGFGNQAVIALAAIFVLGAGLQESGVATLVARGLERVGGDSPTRTILAIMVVVALLSAFMSNAATVAVVLPATVMLARRSGIAPSQLMMPLAFSAILGGMLTLIGTTPNLILDDQMRTRYGEGLGMFEFSLVGGPVAAVGILFMGLVGWRMLPRRAPAAGARDRALPEELARSYGVAGSLYRLRVGARSGLAGRTIMGVGMGHEYGLGVVLVLRPATVGTRSIHPRPDLELAAGDELYVEGEAENAWRLAEEQMLELGIVQRDELDDILGRGVALAEVTLSPRSQAIGKTFKQLGFRRRHGLSVVSIWRGAEATSRNTGDVELQTGDAFLVSGPPEKVRQLAADPDYIVLGDGGSMTEDVARAPLAILLLLLAIFPPLLDWMPLSVSAIAAALAMFLTRCVSLEGARRSVDFTVLFLVIGTIPLGTALERSGVAAAGAESILELEHILGVPGILAALFLLAAVFSTTSNNSAAAVILAPVAAQAAAAAGIDPSRAFLAVAFGTSCAFVLPFAHQCNLMVTGPGGLETRDFVRVGSVMSLLVAATAVVLLAL